MKINITLCTHDSDLAVKVRIFLSQTYLIHSVTYWIKYCLEDEVLFYLNTWNFSFVALILQQNVYFIVQ